MAKEPNRWIQPGNNSYIEEYVEDLSNVVIVERDTTINILKEIFSLHFPGRTNLHILDLGCGTGILTQKLAGQFPDNHYHLLDGSEVMLEKAQEQLEGQQFQFIQKTFEDFIAEPAEEHKYDFICSSNAIHHLDYIEKEKLFNKLYRELSWGGLFINIDPVLPNSDLSEKYQFQMWVNWMNSHLRNQGREELIGKYDDAPMVYKNKEENKPSTLDSQMKMLEGVGFRNVDCFYKYGVFAVFGGTK